MGAPLGLILSKVFFMAGGQSVDIRIADSGKELTAEGQ